MKSRFYQIVCIAISVVLFTACNMLDSNEVELSTDSRFVSLTFKNANAADKNVQTATFKIVKDDNSSDSIIVSVDSLPYNTAIDSVIPTFRFVSTNRVLVFRNDENGVLKDSIYLTGKDTLDFRRVFKIKNYASDGIKSSIYRIKVLVHSLEPELLQWRRLNSSINDDLGLDKKAIYFNNEIFLFSNSGQVVSLTKSTDGVAWTSLIGVSGLPSNVLLHNMVVFNNAIYYVHTDNSIFKSTNGVEWTKTSTQSYPFEFKNLLFVFKSKIWVIVKSDLKYRFATSIDGVEWNVEQSIVLDSNFPISGFAALSFKSRTNQDRVIVAGGYNSNGELLNKVWSSSDGLYWVDFSSENTTFGQRTGVSLIHYEDKLLCFGGADQFGNQWPNMFLQSKDEGLSWKSADSLMWVREKLTDGTYRKYERRYNQNVIVDKDKYIYLIGGRDSANNYFKDVWRGRLNKSVFLIK